MLARYAPLVSAPVTYVGLLSHLPAPAPRHATTRPQSVNATEPLRGLLRHVDLVCDAPLPEELLTRAEEEVRTVCNTSAI